MQSTVNKDCVIVSQLNINSRKCLISYKILFSSFSSLIIIVCDGADLALELTMQSGKLSFRIKGGNKV